MRLPLLVLHISAGTLGILSGFAAIFLRKGSRQHRAAGNVFFISMLTMAVCAVFLAFMKQQVMNVFGGILTSYLVATAWVTARRRDGETGIFDWVALLFALTVAANLVIYGIQVANNPTPSRDGIPVGMYFFLGSVTLLAAVGDVRMIVRGGVFGTQRVARHLWRMSFALFNGAGSLFLGQQQVFPAFLRKTNVLFIPAILPLILMIFWLIRIRFANAYKKELLPRSADIYSLPT
jgi:hypothetical protein